MNTLAKSSDLGGVRTGAALADDIRSAGELVVKMLVSKMRIP